MQPPGITVRECLALKAFKRFEVLTGEVGLDNRLNRAGVLESLDAIYWAKEQSFILTMGYVFKDDVNKLVEILPEMAQCGIAALAIKVDRFLFHLSPEAVEKAQEVGIPLLKAPSDMTHHDAFQSFYEELFNRQYADRLRALHSSYLGRSAAALSLTPILNTLAKQIDLPVILLDAAERIVSASSRIPHVKLTPGCHFSKYEHQFAQDTVFRYSLQTDQQACGYLIVLSREAVLAPAVNLIVSASLAFFALPVLFDIHPKGITEKELLLSLIKNEMDDTRTISQELRRYTLDVQQKYLCMVMIAESCSDKEMSREMMLHAAAEVLAHGARLIGEECPEAKCLAEDAELIVLLPAPQFNATPKKAKVLGQKIVFQSAAAFPGWRLSAGLAAAARPLMQSREGYREAGKAAQIGLKVGSEPVICFDNLMSYVVLSEIQELDQTRHLYQRFIGRLDNYDRQHHTNLLETLEMYCRHNFSIKATSEAMNIHYNSLKYRLKKIEEITGLRPDTSTGIFELIMGLRIRQLWGK